MVSKSLGLPYISTNVNFNINQNINQNYMLKMGVVGFDHEISILKISLKMHFQHAMRGGYVM